MLRRSDVLSMAFLKKSPFTGSLEGMRYRMEQETEEQEEEKTVSVLKVTIWEGPYAYEATPNDKKEITRFPFSEEGVTSAVDWLNEAWQKDTERWKQANNNW